MAQQRHRPSTVARIMELLKELSPAEQDHLLQKAYMDPESPLHAALYRFVSPAISNWIRADGLGLALSQFLSKFTRERTTDALCQEVHRLITVEHLSHKKLADWERIRDRCRTTDWRLVVKGKLPEGWQDWSPAAAQVHVDANALPAASLRRMYGRWCKQKQTVVP
jgi:hypothetical protein